ncbi:MAG TPA: protein kinase [Haliangiales bacterium]|nr:protein kinase [Haliangiales bacterium]
MGDTRDVDPKAATLAAVSRAAGDAAHTLTGPAAVRATASETMVGRQFAHFRVDKPLGAGGMGEVYLATDLALDRPVALKLLPRAFAADPASRERFIREARAQARLNHPNICHIYFIGEQDEQLFFAMEFVEGESLQQILDRQKRIPLVDAVEYARMAALGLREAQRHGFTHRDIKPSNLLLDRHGVVKLVDFGIVKAQTGDSSETGQDVVLGTPFYMSPEQARGDRVDFRSDVYSLGVTIHHLVTGQPPFTGPTPLAVVSRHLTEPRPRLEAKQAVLDGVLEKMMAKRPADRYGGYDELVHALERLSPRRTRPAGFWVRAFSCGLDLLIAAVVSLPLEAVWNALRPRLGLGGSPSWMAFIIPAYFILFHARGRTPGQMALELQLEAESGGKPGLRRAAVRWLVSFTPLYLLWGANEAFDLHGASLVVAAVLLALWVGATLLVRRGDPERRSLGDRVAGTRIVYRPVG